MKKIVYLLLTLQTLVTLQTTLAQPVTQEWARRYSGFGYANGLSVKLDSSGNIYVLLKMYTDTTFNDYGLLKYSNNGNLLWDRYYNSPGNLSEQPVAFCVNDAGDVYITGISSVNFVDRITTVKFNTNGLLQWAKVYNGGGPSDDVGDIKLDRSGNIIIVGSTVTNNNASYCLTIKYNTFGDSIWVKKLTQLPQYSGGWRVAIDDSNNYYIEGDYDNNNTDYLAFKYNTNGDLQWYVTYDSPQHYGDLTWAMDIDTNRNMYVLGTNSVPTALANNTLLKINSIGSIEWAKVFTGIAGINSGCGTPGGISTTSDGNSIYYATPCYNGQSYVIVVLKYNSIGDTEWVRFFGGGINTSQSASPSGIKLDKNGNIYITGSAYFTNTGIDYVTVKYSPNGLQSWVTNYNGPLTNSDDHASDLCIDKNFNIYVTGISSRQNTPQFLWDAATIKYNQPNGIKPNNNELPTSYRLLQNYPNPFNSITVITYELPCRSNIKLTLYNIKGQFVRTLVNAEQNAGNYSVSVNMDDLASGVYFYSLFTNTKQIETKKLILLK